MLRIEVNVGKGTIKSGAVDRILARFGEEAGKLIVAKVQEVLGEDSLYTLSEKYQVLKPKRKGFQRIPNKDPDQPLIFTGEGIYNALTYFMDGANIVVTLDAQKGVTDKGYDYAEVWEEATQFLEKGFALAEPELPELLTLIITEEMLAGFSGT